MVIILKELLTVQHEMNRLLEWARMEHGLGYMRQTMKHAGKNTPQGKQPRKVSL